MAQQVAPVQRPNVLWVVADDMNWDTPGCFGGTAPHIQLGRPHYERADASRVFRADEVRVPGFLPDLPDVRKELADYCTSVRRLDDMVGAVLDELAKARLVENTIVVFMSDQGMQFPSAKVNCYVQSTRSPWIARWPGHVKEGSVDRAHMVSAIDLQPTILEAVGLPPAAPVDGHSFLPLLRGQTQSNREYVFTQFYHIHGKNPYPMRSVLTKQFIYIFNAWSDGQRRFPFRQSPQPGRAETVHATVHGASYERGSGATGIREEEGLSILEW